MEYIYGAVILGMFAIAAVVVGIIYAKAAHRPVSVDEVVGVKCVVTEEIDNYAGCGQVSVGNHEWSARSANDDDTFPVGTFLKVVAVEGAVQICGQGPWRDGEEA